MTLTDQLQVGALETIPRPQRLLYCHAYQV